MATPGIEQFETYALILAAFSCGSETPAPSGGAANYAARAMAFPHALRHALAVALLRGVTALDAKACLEWGYPKEGKWQHDDDCCAGVQQAACAAGYRYVKGCVQIKFYVAFILNHRVVLHAIDAPPAR